MIKKILCLGIAAIAISACGLIKEKEHNYKMTLGKVSNESVFQSDEYSIWGGSVVKGDDGLYHMYYSRWPTDLGWVWVTHSEIAHAVSKSPFGPYKFKDVALMPRGAEKWDGVTTHNPTVRKYGDKYYLYYMGTTGDKKVYGVPGKHKLHWGHRNKQRIGVAVASNPNGPWQRFDKPLIDVTHNDDNASDALVTSNPSITQSPDGSFLMLYKCVGKKFPLPNGGPVVKCMATSDSPTGPFKKHPKTAFDMPGERFGVEDPFLWYQDGKYRAVIKRIIHEKVPGSKREKRVFSLRLFESLDGFDWKPSKHEMISDRTVTWEDGTTEQLVHLERPQLLIENGKPIALICAADRLDENNVRRSFNVQIPITFE